MRRNASATTHTQLTITGFKPAEFNLNFELPELKRTPNVFFHGHICADVQKKAYYCRSTQTYKVYFINKDLQCF